MDRIYASDFNVSESNSNGEFVRVSEINDMIARGIFTLDRDKMKEYHFDTRVEY